MTVTGACENAHLTWKDDPTVFGGRTLDRYDPCRNPAVTERTSRDGRRRRLCAPCAERGDAFRARLTQAVIKARTARGEIIGDYAWTDPLDIKPGDVCAYRFYDDGTPAEVFESLGKPVWFRVPPGHPLGGDRPHTDMEKCHGGRLAYGVRGREAESGREGWVWYRETEWVWRRSLVDADGRAR